MPLLSDVSIFFFKTIIHKPKSLSQEIVQSIMCIDKVQELWEDLKGRFSKGNYFRPSDLLQEIHPIKQGEGSISSYFI